MSTPSGENDTFQSSPDILRLLQSGGTFISQDPQGMMRRSAPNKQTISQETARNVRSSSDKAYIVLSWHDYKS